MVKAELWRLVKLVSVEVSVNLTEAVGWRSKHQGALNNDRWVQHMVRVSQSLKEQWCRQDRGTPPLCSGIGTKLIEIQKPSSNWGHLAGVCAGKLATSHNLSPLPQRGTGKPLSVHSLLGQLGLCWPVDAYISLSPLAMLLGGKLASQLSRNGKRRSDVGFIWLAVFLSCLLMCVSWLCASYRSPRGAPAGLLPFYPGTDDQTMLLIGRRNIRHW